MYSLGINAISLISISVIESNGFSKFGIFPDYKADIAFDKILLYRAKPIS